MKTATDLLAIAFCLAGLLFLPTGCGEAANPTGFRYTAVPVATSLQVPGGEICSEQPETSEVYVPISLRPGDGPWQEGTDLFLQMGSNSGKFPYGLIFLHGGSEVVPDKPGNPPSRGFACDEKEAVPAEIGFVQRLLRDLGGGIAAFPQALPKFDQTIYTSPADNDCPSEKICFDFQDPERTPDFNAVCNTISPRWLPPVPKNDYEDEGCHIIPGSNALAIWKPFFEEYGERVKTIVRDFHRDRGIPLEKIYLLGFSEGAVMAQRALLSLAKEGIRIGGGIGFDGNDVQMIASKETFENLSPPHPDILYFRYSGTPESRMTAAKCIQSYPGINVQFYQPPENKDDGTHSVYLSLIQPTRLWIQARNKENARTKVQEAWNSAAEKIIPCPPPSTQ